MGVSIGTNENQLSAKTLNIYFYAQYHSVQTVAGCL